MSDETEGSGLSLQIFADLTTSIDKLQTFFKNWVDQEWAYEFGTTDVKLAASGAAPSSGSLFLDLGGPAPGKLWHLRRLTAGGITWVTTAAGSINVYQTPSTNLTTGGALIDVVDTYPTLPTKAYYSTHQVVLHNPDHLIVEFASPTSSQTYAVGGLAEVQPDVAAIKRLVEA